MQEIQRMMGKGGLALALAASLAFSGSTAQAAEAEGAPAATTAEATTAGQAGEGQMQQTRVSSITAVQFYQRFTQLCEQAGKAEGATFKVAPTTDLKQMLPEEWGGVTWQNYMFAVQVDGDKARTDDQGTVFLQVDPDNYVGRIFISAPQSNQDVAFACVTASLGAIGLDTEQAMPLLEGALSSGDQRAIVETQDTLGRSIGLAGEVNGDMVSFTIVGFVE